MALLDSEGFGWTTTLSDLTTYGAFLTATGSSSTNISTNGPLGDNYINLASSFNVGQALLVRFLPSTNMTTIYTGCRYNNLGSTGGNYQGIAFLDSATAMQFQIYMNPSTYQVQAYRGSNYSGTLLGSSAVNVFPPTGWFYLEVYVLIGSGTSGAVTVRINGQSVLTLTGQNTQNTANAGAWKIALGQTANAIGQGNGNGSQGIAHWYLCDGTGSAPWNTFLGDVRVQTILPTSNATVQFTPSPASVTETLNPNIASGISDTANTVYFDRWTTTTGGALNSITLTVQTGYTGHLKMAIYSDNGSGYPNALLGTSSAITNPTTGNNTVTFSGVTLTSSTIYWIAIVTDTTFTIETAGSGPANYRNSYSLAYSSAFAATAPAGNATTTSFSTYTMNISPENFNVAATIPPNPSTFYNSDSTVGNQDTFNTAGTAASTSTIYGIHHKGIYLKNDSGSRSMQSVLVSGGTTGTGASTALNTSGAQVRTMFETDPNTSAQWTTTAANAAQPGYNVSA